MLGDPGDVPQLRQAVAAWVDEHPEDADAAREGMEAVEQMQLLYAARRDTSGGG